MPRSPIGSRQVEPFDNLNDAISRAKPHGIVVSSPTTTHGQVIKVAADNKISVFTEKPVDETAQKIEVLFDYAEKCGIALCCGFQRRFDASYVAATEAVSSGQVGKPVMANLFFSDHPVPSREFLLAGGNIFMDLAAHDVDYITHTLQDEVVSVYALGTSSDEELAAAGVHDSALMVMRFSRGEREGNKMMTSFQCHAHLNLCFVSRSDGESFSFSIFILRI
jgi:myo-inositol 2-dehydrogenase/D-chiro-inositol 1-dehydrogenase